MRTDLIKASELHFKAHIEKELQKQIQETAFAKIHWPKN